MSKTKPSGVVYVPKERTVVDIGSLSDGDNEHLYMLKFKSFILLYGLKVLGRAGEINIVCSSSVDGKSFSEPRLVVLERVKRGQASWAFPVVNTSGRIYLSTIKKLILAKGK